MRPALHIITVSYRSRPHLGHLISSLSRIDPPKDLIIVNHAQGDDLSDLRADFPISVIAQDNKGYGAGLNRGFRELVQKEGVLLLCNPDVSLINTEHLNGAIDFLHNNKDVGILLPTLVNGNSRRLPSCRNFYNFKSIVLARMPRLYGMFCADSDKQAVSPAGEVDWGSGAAMLVRPDVFDVVQFDERYFLYFEDVDFCAQVWKQGYKVVHYPELVINHDEQKLSRTSYYGLICHIGSFCKFVVKYRGLPTRESLLQEKVKNPSALT